MNEGMRIAWAITGLLIGAGLLTYLTQGSGQILNYEVDRKKKSKKKKRRMETQYPLSVRDETSETSVIDTPSSFEQTDQKLHNY